MDAAEGAGMPGDGGKPAAASRRADTLHLLLQPGVAAAAAAIATPGMVFRFQYSLYIFLSYPLK